MLVTPGFVCMVLSPIIALTLFVLALVLKGERKDASYHLLIAIGVVALLIATGAFMGAAGVVGDVFGSSNLESMDSREVAENGLAKLTSLLGYTSGATILLGAAVLLGFIRTFTTKS